MKQVSAPHAGGLVLLHGGAGPMDPTAAGVARAVESLTAIGRRGYRLLERGQSAIQVACFCCGEMERDPQFNAGVGSALQMDGVARLSAALMDGQRQRFSGVVNASYLSTPSRLSLALQSRAARVLTSPGVELVARELGLPVGLNLVDKRVRRWLKSQLAQGLRPLSKQPRATSADTVGCLVRSGSGRLGAAASTGGRGFEYPGRVSDTCSVAGTYASRFAAVVATGVGEEIVDDALACRLEARVRDGAPLGEASARCFREAVTRKRAYGWLGVDREAWCVAHTTRAMPFVVLGRRGRRVVVISSALDQSVGR